MDWTLFLEDNQIAYVTRGTNTKRGEVSVRCPWCGEDDPSQHLGISLTSENWGCLRNRSHSGHKAPYLIAALLGISQSQAKLIAAQYSGSDPSGLGEALALLEGTSEPDKPAEGPPEPKPPLQPIFVGDRVKRRFWDYLKNRGFNNPAGVARDYTLTCCTTGKFKDRIIIPIYLNHELVAWTGRAIIDPKSAPRYLSSKNLKSFIFNQQELREAGGRTLFICEGPFDALKMDFYGRDWGARATCTFGTNVTIPQIIILSSLRKNFDRVRVLFDNDAYAQAQQLVEWLPGCWAAYLGEKDPGDLTASQVRLFIKGSW